MKTVIITQARTGSTRLPGKVLKKVLNKTMLQFHLERLLKVECVDEVIVATTTKPNDDKIVSICDHMKVSYFRGSEKDVLSRYFEAAQKFKADNIMRVTSDCPLIDPDILTNVIQYFLGHINEYDYVANFDDKTRVYPLGMECEIFSFLALEKAYQKAILNTHREHVTPYIWTNKNIFRCQHLLEYPDYHHLRWTLDTAEDFTFLKKILENIYPQKPQFRIDDILDLLQTNPEWPKINSHIPHNYYEDNLKKNKQ